MDHMRGEVASANGSDLDPDVRRFIRTLADSVARYPQFNSAPFPQMRRWAEEARSAQRWTVRDDGSYAWRLEPRQPLRLPLLAVTAAAAQLLAEGPLEAVHACPGNDCGWLFLDPRNRRRWCSMAVCGNRAKARAHARRGDRA